MNKKPMSLLLGCLLTASVAMQANAQHELISGDMAPGKVAHLYQQANPSLIGHIQPVQLVAPPDTTIEIGDAASSFGQAQANQMTVAMGIGYVYRFKLSDLPLPDTAGQTLYPSIEVIGKLSPPPGLENDFPIQVVVTRDDIDLALTGRMVTRVIYLEDPRGTLPHLHTEAAQPSMDVRRGQDPLRAAEQMGRPMAILRMGSRVPLENEVAEWFTFGISAPQVLPNPRPANLAGLNDRELEIVRAMNEVEVKANANTKSEANKEAKSAAENESKDKQSDQVTRADFNAGDTDQPELSQTANEEVSGNFVNHIGTSSQTVFANTPVASSNTAVESSNLVQFKANATPSVQVKLPKIKDMIPNPLPLSSGKKLNARPPAPSMSLFYFEPLVRSPKAVRPLATPTIRRPNEL